MDGITFMPKLVSKQIERGSEINNTVVLTNRALLSDTRPFHKRAKSQVFNRLFLD